MKAIREIREMKPSTDDLRKLLHEPENESVLENVEQQTPQVYGSCGGYSDDASYGQAGYGQQQTAPATGCTQQQAGGASCGSTDTAGDYTNYSQDQYGQADTQSYSYGQAESNTSYSGYAAPAANTFGHQVSAATTSYTQTAAQTQQQSYPVCGFLGSAPQTQSTYSSSLGYGSYGTAAPTAYSQPPATGAAQASVPPSIGGYGSGIPPSGPMGSAPTGAPPGHGMPPPQYHGGPMPPSQGQDYGRPGPGSMPPGNDGYGGPPRGGGFGGHGAFQSGPGGFDRDSRGGGGYGEQVQPENLLTAFQAFRKEVAAIYHQISAILQTCDQLHLRRAYKKYICHLNAATSLFKSIDSMVENSTSITSDMMKVASSFLSNLHSLHVEVSEDAEQACLKALEENSKEIHIDAVSERDDVKNNISATDEFLDGLKQVPKPENMEEDKTQSAGLNDKAIYLCAVQYIMKMEEGLKTFKEDPKHKKFRMDLHKATAINTLTHVSVAQLKTKIDQLVALLNGMPVKCGKTEVTCKHDPAAENYCKNILAKNIVSQGEMQVFRNSAAAFPFAAVTVAVCAKVPDIWPLILGHFYRCCPYLVPYFPQREGQSDLDYYHNLGYKYKDGKLEDLTNFLKRMHGYGVLFAAILMSKLPNGSSQRNCYNLSFGWTWMAKTLHLEPIPDVSSTMILAFLQVLGLELNNTYNIQFKKMLKILYSDYIKKLDDVHKTSVPAERLKDFLKNAPWAPYPETCNLVQTEELYSKSIHTRSGRPIKAPQKLDL